jgi:hypothetical protein
MSEENTSIDKEAYDVEKEIRLLYENLSPEEKSLFENFELKIGKILEKAQDKKLDNIDNDEPLDFSEKHPEILHPKHITNAPHEITVYVKAEVSEIDENGHLAETKDLFEKYYHIPVRNQKDYRIYVDKFFEKFHSNLELTCQEIHTNNQNADA